MSIAQRKTQTSKTPDIESLCQKFIDRKAVIGVVGLGYVGLPLIRAVCDHGFKAVGFDIDPKKIKKLNEGISYIDTVDSDHIAGFVKDGFLTATDDPARTADVDAVLLCVPTPLNKNREPDMRYVENTLRSIGPYLQKGQLIVLESTTWPGTTRELMQPLLEDLSGLVAGKDFYLAFSPEREDPGNEKFHTAIIPKVIGADDEDARRLATTMYDQFLSKTVPVSSTATAEAVKLTENIFRSVNIALVNELKIIYDGLGIDIWEVIEAAKTKPFGYMPFYPGPGLGGHCIPIDPFYLSWKAREYGLTARFIELAGEINITMPGYVIDRLAEALDTRFAKPLNGSKILLIGLAYKKNVADDRESPAYALMHLLQKRKATFIYHDPYVKSIPPTRKNDAFTGIGSVDLTPDMIAAQDAVIIVTDHDGIDYDMIAAHAPLIVDTRNALAHVEDREKIIKA